MPIGWFIVAGVAVLLLFVGLGWLGKLGPTTWVLVGKWCMIGDAESPNPYTPRLSESRQKVKHQREVAWNLEFHKDGSFIQSNFFRDGTTDHEGFSGVWRMDQEMFRVTT